MYIKYLKNGGTFLDLTKTKTTSERIGYYELTNDENIKCLESLKNKDIIKILKNKLLFFKDENLKREKIVNERNNLIDIAGRFIDRPTYTNKLGLTAEELSDAEEYYNRLLDMPQHYDDSDDKQGWDFVFVESYTSGKNTNKYQLMKPYFLK